MCSKCPVEKRSPSFHPPYHFTCYSGGGAGFNSSDVLFLRGKPIRRGGKKASSWLEHRRFIPGQTICQMRQSGVTQEMGRMKLVASAHLDYNFL